MRSYDAARFAMSGGEHYALLMKGHQWNRQRRKTSQVEKRENKRSLIERVAELNLRELGRLAGLDASIADALSLVRAEDLEKKNCRDRKVPERG